MEKINYILNNKTYIRLMNQIKESEKERRFCCHGLEHCMDVARIAMLLNLEEQRGVRKELIYAAALLHDIGRAEAYKSGEEHHLASVRYSRDILNEAGFSSEDIEEITGAINQHNTTGKEASGLSALLYRADKLSRLCFQCEMYDACYWSEQEKNKGVIY